MLEVLRLQDHFIGPRKISCKKFLNKESFAREKLHREEGKLFVKFIPWWVSDLQFRNYFEEFGELETCYRVRFIDRNKPHSLQKTSGYYGYLIFKDASVGQRVLAHKYYKIGNTKMKVQKFEHQELGLQTSCSPKNNDTHREERKGKEPKSLKDEIYEEDHDIKPTQRSYIKTRSGFDSRSRFDSLDKEKLTNLRFNCKSRFRPRGQSLFF